MSSNPTTETNREIVMRGHGHNIFGFIVMLVVAVGFMIWLNMIESVQTATPVQQTGEFLGVCSGMKVTEHTRATAVANCLGHINGFVAGHDLVVEMARANGQDTSKLVLWCMPRMSHGQVYDAVVDWANNHANVVAAQIDNGNGAEGVIIAALHNLFPCRK